MGEVNATPIKLPEAKLHKPSGQYRARKQIGKTRLEGWGNTPEIATAEFARKAAKLLVSYSASQSQTLRWFLDGPHKAIRETKRSRNREQIEWAITHIPERWLDCDPATITRTEAQAWAGSLNMRLNSRRHVLRCVKAIFEYMADDDVITRNPLAKVVLKAPEDKHDPILGTKEIVPLTSEELGRLIRGSRGYAAHASIVICGLLGVRLGECRRLAPRSFHPRKKVVDVPGSKSEAAKRSLYCPSRILREIAGDTFPFVPLSDSSARTALLRVSTKVLGKPISHHTLRHTFTTGLEQLGCPESVRAKIIGHGPKTITGRYSHAQAVEFRTWMVQWCRTVYCEVGSKVGERNSVSTIVNRN